MNKADAVLQIRGPVGDEARERESSATIGQREASGYQRRRLICLYHGRRAPRPASGFLWASTDGRRKYRVDFSLSCGQRAGRAEITQILISCCCAGKVEDRRNISRGYGTHC